MTEEDPDEEGVSGWMRSYPPPDISPAEFESFVVELYEAVRPQVYHLRIALRERIQGMDGSYVFDATVRHQFAGADYLTIVEAKMHKNPIKRQLVQTLHSKALSVGAHKAVMISTAPYQKGALGFAKAHGIALVSLTEGRFTYKTKSVEPSPHLTRQQAAERFGLPTFVGFSYGPGKSPGSTTSTLISTEHPEYIHELLLPRANR